jgi:hypothetical protein
MWPKIGPLSAYGILYLTQLLCGSAALVALWVLVSWLHRPAGSDPLLTTVSL